MVRRPVGAGVNAAVGRRPLQVAASPEAVGLRLALVAAATAATATGAAAAHSHLVPLVAVAVAPAGRRAGQRVAAGVS